VGLVLSEGDHPIIPLVRLIPTTSGGSVGAATHGESIAGRGAGRPIGAVGIVRGERPTPERCVEAYYLQRTRFERIAERKLRHRVLTEDGNVEINGRDLHEGSAAANARGNRTIAGRL
jgi:hypothetical protein